MKDALWMGLGVMLLPLFLVLALVALIAAMLDEKDFKCDCTRRSR